MANEPTEDPGQLETEMNTMFVDALGDVGNVTEEAPAEAIVEETPPEPTPEEPPTPDAEPAAEQPPEESPAAEPEPEPEPSESLTALLATADEIGLPLDGITSEAELATAVMTQMKGMQAEVLTARQLQQQYVQPQPEPAPEPEKPQEWSEERYFQEKYGGQPWKDQYTQAVAQGAIERNEQGLYAPTAGNESLAGLAGEMNSATLHREKFYGELGQKNLYKDVYDVLSEPIQRMIDSRVQAAIGSHETENQARTQMSSFEQANAHWIYKTDPSTGQTVYSDKGQELATAYEEAWDEGAKDPAIALKWALKGFEIPTAATEKVDDNTPPPVVNAQPEVHNQQVSENTQRQGTQQQSFLERSRDRAGHSPSERGRESDDAPQVLTEGDLDNTFLLDFKQQKARVG